MPCIQTVVEEQEHGLLVGYFAPGQHDPLLCLEEQRANALYTQFYGVKDAFDFANKLYKRAASVMGNILGGLEDSVQLCLPATDLPDEGIVIPTAFMAIDPERLRLDRKPAA